MKKIILAIVLFGTTMFSYSQELEKHSRLEIEIDPIAYILQGYSFHGIFAYNRLRTDLGVFAIVQPEGFTGNKGFQVNTNGFGLKVNYLLNEKQTWYTGIGFGYSNNNIKQLKTDKTQSESVFGFGLHLGYRWFMFKNVSNKFRSLYLSPWFSIDYNFPLNSIYFDGDDYTQKAITFFPTIHIGYKF